MFDALTAMHFITLGALFWIAKHILANTALIVVVGERLSNALISCEVDLNGSDGRLRLQSEHGKLNLC